MPDRLYACFVYSVTGVAKSVKISDLYHVYAVYDASDAILHQFRNMLIYEHIFEFSLKSVNQTAYLGDTKSSKAATIYKVKTSHPVPI